LIFPKTKAGKGPGAECRIFLPAPMINGRKASAKKDPDAVFLRVKTMEKKQTRKLLTNWEAGMDSFRRKNFNRA
jgi:hypothetical protein